ncbi:MAG: UbiA family prenyltransferase [Candidatus Marinimicrobia bacterium]|nr:UbiA family prenyltransferase [Candidatus Neomarinimicrobiota bacterium]
MSLQLYKTLKKDLDTQKYVTLSSCYGTNVSSMQIQYINIGFDIYVIINENSKIAQQVEYNPEVNLVFDSASNAKSKGIELKGLIEKIEDKDENFEWAKKFTDRYRRFKSYFFSRRTFVYHIKPIEIQRTQFEYYEEDSVLEFKENDRSLVKKILFKSKVALRAWLEATRFQYITAPLASVFLGTAIAWNSGHEFNLYYFLMTLLGISFVYLGFNLINELLEYLTVKNNSNLNPNTLTGGYKVIQKGIFSPEKALLSGLLLILLGFGTGLHLALLMNNYWIILIGFSGVLFSIGYSAPVLKYSKFGLSEIIIGFAFGTIITLGSYFIQSKGGFSILPIIASVPLSFFVIMILFINEFQDYRDDKNSSKQTIVVAIGDKFKAMKLFSILLFIPYLWVLPFAVFGLLPWWSLLMTLTLPMAIVAIRQGSTKYRKIQELLIVNRLTIWIHLLTALLLSFAFVLDKII